MAAKKAPKGGKTGEPPESIVGEVMPDGKLLIDTDKLDKFIEGLKLKKSAKVQFVARNAPFMRQSPTLPV